MTKVSEEIYKKKKTEVSYSHSKHEDKMAKMRPKKLQITQPKR